MTGGATPTPLETVLAGLSHASWQAAVLGLLVFLVSGVLRGRLEPRWRFCLWLVVLARLALPVIPPAPWSVFRLVTVTPRVPTTGRPAEPPAAPPGPANDDRGGGDAAIGEPVAEVAPRPVVPADLGREAAPGLEAEPGRVAGPIREVEPAREAAEPSPGTTIRWLGAGWLAGVLVVLARHGWSHVQIRRERRLWQEVTDPAARDILRRCLDDLPVARPLRLLTAPGRFGPATCGTLRPTIVIPEDLLEGLTPDELRLVLLHELTHVRRWDVLVDRVATLVVAAHWFNPVAWLVLACLRRDRELACDAAVLRHLGERDRGRYGHTLLNVAGRLVAPVRMPGAVGALVKDQSLVRRIRMIAHYRTPGTAGKVLGGLLFLGLAAVGLTDAAAGSSRDAGPAGTPPTANGEPAKTIALTGLCEDETGKALPGVRVVLFRKDQLGLKVERLRTEMTGDDGRFQFRDLPPFPADEDGAGWEYTIAVTKPGRSSRIQSLHAGREKYPFEFRLPPAATLKGRVTDPAGRPVAGAQVWWVLGPSTGPLEVVWSTRTDADGQYAITDLAARVLPEPTTIPDGKGGTLGISCGDCYFDVRHPDYGHERPRYRRLPDTVDVVLQPAGVITGRVVDRVTGKPAAGVLVSARGVGRLVPAQGTQANWTPSWHQMRTAADGTYRLPSLTAGKYTLWADAPDRACAALDSLAVEAGKTYAAPDLALVEGGWLEGRLVDVQTGNPVHGTKIEQMCVGLYGPSRPKFGGDCQSGAVDDQGRFRLRVAPGINYPFIMNQDYWARTQRREYYETGVEVKAGEVVSVEFRILPTKPVADPEPTPVRLVVPVPAEREAAALIRRLGGWYQVDADNHVVEVNMVYHETANKYRYDNKMIDTDEALRAVGSFPRLKRLFLKNRQATDDGLRALTGLGDLEVLMVWDAGRITDAGVGHLAGLTKLQKVHFSNGKLGDDALAVFGRLPAIRELSLQGNSISDDGLKHLAGLKQLRSLWVGMSRRPITDAGARHLAGLTALEELDLQKAQLTDAGVAALKDLKELRSLYLRGDREAITDASIEHLLGMTKLQRLWVHSSSLTGQRAQRLLGLADLKELFLSSSAIPQGRREQLRQQRPGLKLYFSDPSNGD
ncbi:MAG: Regulatory sensor-transducer, BlaR1/MecR1 family [Gemmataceae bacterium]|nr:Regulatory sensor-transducer, BlaR1/MecR1 family [Gemmataceae bacterium]